MKKLHSAHYFFELRMITLSVNLVVSYEAAGPLYAVLETANLSNLSEKTVRRLIKNERLRAIRLRRDDGHRGPVRVTPADLEDLIRDHRSH